MYPIPNAEAATQLFVVAQLTVKMALAVPPLASVAVTRCAPALTVLETVKVAENEPPEVVVIVAGEVVCRPPSNFIVVVEVGAKFVPVTVTTVPPRPEIGLSVIAGAVVVKIALPVFPLALVAMTE